MMDMFDFDNSLIKITDYQLAGNLPDPFAFDDGTPVKKPEQWDRRRAEIHKTAVELQFGHMPPEPEFLEVEPICLTAPGKPNTYRINTGRRDKPVSFNMVLFRSKTVKKAPVAITGDLCFGYMFDKDFLDQFMDNGIHFCAFNRCELAPDVSVHTKKHLVDGSTELKMASQLVEAEQDHVCRGPLKEAYPEYDFGSVAAWAWGFMRCVDALEILECADMSCVAFTGHSRGAKAAILAGACDKRATIVNPNEACAGGCSCYRLNIKAINEDGAEKPSEPISNIFKCFPAWMGGSLLNYVGREEELPFDSHFLKAMIAPRVLLVGEAASDIWSNPVGSWQTSMAASEVYKFLGCEKNLLWYFRRGYHYHHLADISQLVNVILHVYKGEPLNDHYFKLPFEAPAPIFEWSCPK